MRLCWNFTGGCDKWYSSCSNSTKHSSCFSNFANKWYGSFSNFAKHSRCSVQPLLPSIQTVSVQSVSTAPGSVPNVGITTDPSTNESEVIILSDSAIPEGFKKTKWDFTLEKIDLSKPSPGQKAPKRFFCSKCMKKDVLTGYTKRNDLSIHLQSCGKEKEKKFKCTYKDCESSYVRSDNLKQHIAKEHTKKIYIHVRSVIKGFTPPQKPQPIEKSATLKNRMMTIQPRIFQKMIMMNGKNKTVEIEDENKDKGEGENVEGVQMQI